MNNPNLAVRFGEHQTGDSEIEKAFPFFYSLVPSTSFTWVAVTGATQPNVNNAFVSVPASSKVTVPVVMEADCNFKLISVRYEAIWWDSVNSVYRWYYNPGIATATVADTGDPDMEHLGTPFYHFISITLACSSLGGKILYGGQGINSAGVAVDIPIVADSIQGNDYGIYSARTPNLLPRQGTLIFTINNSHSAALYVSAIAYGMKVRV